MIEWMVPLGSSDRTSGNVICTCFDTTGSMEFFNQTALVRHKAKTKYQRLVWGHGDLERLHHSAMHLRIVRANEDTACLVHMAFGAGLGALRQWQEAPLQDGDSSDGHQHVPILAQGHPGVDYRLIEVERNAILSKTWS